MITEKDLARRLGPRLSDGTHVGELIDVDKREVAMRVYSDPEIYQLELDRIFNHSWLKVGHASEVPNPGDYILSFMGEDSVIVIRGQDGEIAILLNVCAHRGMEVCWGQRGNARTFMCPYHSWVYNDKGGLVGAPLERQMYETWDKSGYGLRRVRTEIRHGYIFGNFDDSAISFEDWLGEDFLFYWDTLHQGHENYEPIGPPSESFQRANWKIGVDQNTGDAYHALGTHKALVEAGVIPSGGLRNMCDTVKVTFPGYGHTVMGFGSMNGRELPESERYGWNRPDTNEVAPGQIGVQVIFPASGGAGARSYSPRGPSAHLFLLQPFVPKDTPEEARQAMRKMFVTSTALAIDDLDAYESIQKSASRGFGRKQTMKYNAAQAPNRPEGWPERGEVRAGFSRDDNQWSWWVRYFEMMTDPEA